jgi:hypothetical protein
VGCLNFLTVIIPGCALAAYLGIHVGLALKVAGFVRAYEDNFNTFRTGIWDREDQVSGFGTGEFEWTTIDPANVVSTLIIVPTLTDQVRPTIKSTMDTLST